MDWQPIETAPKDGRVWEVSDHGVVKCNQIECRIYMTDRGYSRFTMGGKSTSLHRIVAMAFIPNPDSLPEVNHLNGDKSDNRAANLEWCTRSHNMKHAYATGLHPGVVMRGEDSPNWRRNGKKHPQSMAVRATFSDGTTRDFESQGLAELNGFRADKISRCIHGHNKTHGGASWTPLPPPPETNHAD